MFCDYQLCRFVSVAAIAGKLCDLGESELLESTARWVFLEHLKVSGYVSRHLRLLVGRGHASVQSPKVPCLRAGFV
jgi:hypothetical protein